MKKTFLSFATLALFSATSVAAADKTWTGKIGDSSCGATHKAAAEHSAKKMSDRDCTLACVKNGGKYIFVSKGKVYNLDNQDYAGLQEHAGHTVKLTGEMTGDSIKVSSIAMPGKSTGKMKEKEKDKS